MSLTKVTYSMIKGVIFNPADYGAVFDGVADDSVAVQSAFTAANGTGGTVVFNGAACKIASPLSLNNYSKFNIDFGQCRIEYTGGSGTYLFDMTQAGDMSLSGGFFTASGNTRNFIKTKGSAAAQATTYPTIPADDQWSRRLYVNGATVTGFANVLDLQNFTREMWVNDCNFSNNTKAVSIVGKVVNLHVGSTILYSAVASSNSIVCRGDSGDAAWRYAEGLFFNDCICDVQGYAIDIQDFYLLKFSGGQIQSPSYGVAVTKGICPLTRNFWFTDVQFNGRTIIGSGLASQFLFDGTFDGVFQGIADTAVGIVGYAKNIRVSGQFDTPTGTPVALSVGPNCIGVNFDATIEPTYTTELIVDPTSVAATSARVVGTWTPQVQFGGASVGVTYAVNPEGVYEWNGNSITAYFKIQLSNKGSSTGTATIAGLPYPALVDGVGSIGKYNGFNINVVQILSVNAGSQSVNIKSAGTGSEVILTDVDFSNVSVLNGMVQYIVSSV
jgi:hypothetical protein